MRPSSREPVGPNGSRLEDLVEQLSAVSPVDFAKERVALAARLAKLGQSAEAARIKSDARDAERMRLAATELCALLDQDVVKAIARVVTLDDRGTTPADLAADRAALDAWLQAAVSD